MRRRIDRRGGADIGQAQGSNPRIDASSRGGVGVAGLEYETRIAGAGEMNDVLARAARDLQHQPALRQIVLEDRQDRISVAGRSRGIVPGIIVHGSLVVPVGATVKAGQPGPLAAKGGLAGEDCAKFRPAFAGR